MRPPRPLPPEKTLKMAYWRDFLSGGQGDERRPPSPIHRPLDWRQRRSFARDVTQDIRADDGSS